MANEATAVIPQRFPAAVTQVRTNSGIPRSIQATLPNLVALANKKVAHSKYKTPARVRATKAGSCFLHSRKKSRAIRICVAIVSTVIRMSAIRDPLR